MASPSRKHIFSAEKMLRQGREILRVATSKIFLTTKSTYFALIACSASPHIGDSDTIRLGQK